MEMLGQITGQVAAFIILAFLLELMAPDKKWRRYLNILTGLFMILTLMAPMRTTLFLYPELSDSNLPVDSGLWEERMVANEEDMRFFWDQSYERELSAALKERLDSVYEGVTENVTVRVSGGEIQEVQIEIREGQAAAAGEGVRDQALRWLPVNIGQIKIIEGFGLEEAR
jgi:hypothetical protein